MSKKKKQKSMEELLEEALVPEEEQPYPVPENWIWTRLGNLVHFIGGGTPSKTVKKYWDGNIPWATVKDIKGKYLLQTKDSITEEGLNNSSASLAAEEELIVVTRMSPGKAIISKIKTAINQDLKIVKPKTKIHSGFLWIFFEVNRPLIESLSTGSTVKGIQIKKLDELLISLPPYEEQKRIAEKVERLFAKIDEAKRLIKEVKESIELRRTAILDKAFKGQLGTNDPNEKSMLETSNDIKEESLIPKEKQPYEVPENWVWVRLKTCLKNLQYGYTASSSPLEEGPKYLRITDIQNDSVDWETVPHCKIDSDQLEKYKLNKGDIVIARTGATTGKSFLIDDAPSSVFASYLIRLTTNDSLNPRYLWNYLKSPMYWKQITVVKKGIAQPGANAKIIGGLIIPLPPVNEQHRIVEKVTYLLSKLENEKEKVLEVEEKLDLLKQSILSKAFRGELGTNDPTEESAIELLKEVLQSK